MKCAAGLLYLLFYAATASAQSADSSEHPRVILSQALGALSQMRTLECSFRRIQTLDTLTKVANGRFLFKKNAGFAYHYRSPGLYSFYFSRDTLRIVDQKALIGHFAPSAANDNFQTLYFSTHLLYPLFDAPDQAASWRYKGSAGDLLYFAHAAKKGESAYCIGVSRTDRRMHIVEQFDSEDAVIMQMVAYYNSQEALWPDALAIRRKMNGLALCDSLAMGKTRVDRQISDAFLRWPKGVLWRRGAGASFFRDNRNGSAAAQP